MTSSSNQTTAEIDSIRYVTTMIIQKWSFVLLSLGTIGHILNICVLTRPALRSSPCIYYFLASAISGLIVTYTNVLLRLLQLVYDIDLFAYSLGSCKTLIYITFWARTQTSWFITFACIDRYLCSSRSSNARALSTKRVALRIIVLSTVIGGLFYIYIPIQYTTVPAGRFKCPSNQSNPSLLHGIWSLILYSIGPPMIMIIFGSLTIRHLHQSLKRIAPSTIEIINRQPLQRRKTKDQQLIGMMIFQCIYFCLLSIPLSINWIYTSLKSNSEINALQSAKDDMFVQIVGYLSLTCACTNFYVFTLTSQLFRRELINLFKF